MPAATRLRTDAVPQGAGPAAWQQETIHELTEVARVTTALEAAMLEGGYPSRDRFAVLLAAAEALVNAIKHGNCGDRRKQVRVRYRVGTAQVLVEVEDEGPGFDPPAVPDPLAPENLAKTSGRGLLLINAYSTWVRHNARGNRVTFCRSRTA
jgi:anti-sigma regulatory factor (Ser/Thr protein kinase)